jgi:hypothetical protein
MYLKEISCEDATGSESKQIHVLAAMNRWVQLPEGLLSLGIWYIRDH